jgi:hypothetical protein
MRTVFFAAVCSTVAGLGVAASPALAKTVKECRAEWQAHKDVFQPKGISEHDYVEECRDFPGAPPETTAVATPAPAAAAPVAVKPVPAAAVPAAVKPAPAAAVPAVVKPAHVVVAAPVAPRHPSTEADAAKPKKPEATSRVSSRDNFNSQLAHELDRSAHKSNAQLGSAVSSPPPAPFSASESCVTRHSNTIIHSERCGF